MLTTFVKLDRSILLSKL